MSAVIETPRLSMSRPVMDDAAEIEAMTRDEPMRRFLPSTSPEDAFNRFLRNEGCWSFFGYGPLVVRDKDSGDFLGQCGLFRAHRGLGEDFDPFPEAGWVIAPDHRGNGYAGEAMRAILEWARDDRGIERVVAIIDPDNAPSLSLADTLGFRPIGEAEYHDKRVMRFAWEGD